MRCTVRRRARSRWIADRARTADCSARPARSKARRLEYVATTTIELVQKDVHLPPNLINILTAEPSTTMLTEEPCRILFCGREERSSCPRTFGKAVGVLELCCTEAHVFRGSDHTFIQSHRWLTATRQHHEILASSPGCAVIMARSAFIRDPCRSNSVRPTFNAVWRGAAQSSPTGGRKSFCQHSGYSLQLAPSYAQEQAESPLFLSSIPRARGGSALDHSGSFDFFRNVRPHRAWQV